MNPYPKANGSRSSVLERRTAIIDVQVETYDPLVSLLDVQTGIISRLTETQLLELPVNRLIPPPTTCPGACLVGQCRPQ